ncbi:MAG: translocation/assembly module TamB domain-containing protein [Sulfuricurvum sp.]|nr:translocation/assembly module TamB domain-containing protein [Sulfuricurvum sp.]
MSPIRSFPWRRWLKHLFVVAHFLLYSIVITASVLMYIAFRPDGLQIINSYFLEPMGVRYAHAEGSLLEGFTLYDVHTDKAEAKTFLLKYNLVQMLQGEHAVESVKIEGLRIHLDDFLSDSGSLWPFPTFKLKEVDITNLQLIGSYPIELDIHAKNGTYDGDWLNFAVLNATLKSRYASAAIRGIVHNNAIRGVGDIYPNAAELAPYSGRFTTLPRSVRVKISELSDRKALLHTTLDRLISKQDGSIHADAISLDFTYVYDNDYFDINALYRLVRGNDTIQTTHHLRYAVEGKTTSEFDGIVTSSVPLPSNKLHGEFSDDADGFNATLSLDGSTMKIASRDYEHFGWSVKSTHQNLSFVASLPQVIRNGALDLSGEGTYALGENLLSGSIHTSHDHFMFDGKFLTQNNHRTLEGELTLPSDAMLWKNWAHKPPEHFNLSISNAADTTHLNLSGEALAFSVSAQGDRVKGSGNYLGTFFDLTGSISAAQSHLEITSVTPSLFATLSQLEAIKLQKGEYYDAEIRTKTEIDMGSSLVVQSDIKIPWYAAVLDSKRAYGGTDGSVKLEYRDGNIRIERYRFEIADHPISTDKTSYLHMDENGDVIVDDFWVYDTLHVSGIVKSDLSSNLRLQSERFSYSGPEGDAHASADIRFMRDDKANQSLFGTLNILDATVTYLPLQEFKVMDDDIIIIQDVRPPSDVKFSINLHIIARQPIRFKTKELDLGLIPDITLWKEPTEPMQILGMMTIPSGNAVSAGKKFDIKHSEIYFGGDIPLNPYLDITIGHEVDYKKLSIYVTHTLESPIFLFSSDPVMSQNDIMSYLLFGGPANSMGGTGDKSTSTVRADATNFMLGAGLKGLINGATKLQIDTMNILTTQQGGMGFEVGARLNKDLRVLYKNDTVSSVLVQYSVNRWLRLDADIHELGQGINAIYIKDFRDVLPHNPPKKR